jgi:hypothetical protein
MFTDCVQDLLGNNSSHPPRHERVSERQSETKNGGEHIEDESTTRDGGNCAVRRRLIPASQGKKLSPWQPVPSVVPRKSSTRRAHPAIRVVPPNVLAE